MNIQSVGLTMLVFFSATLTGCQGNEGIAEEACSISIERNLKAPSTLKIIEKSASYAPAIPIGADDKTAKYQYLTLYLEYDAENSFGSPIRASQRCDFLLKNGELQNSTQLSLYGAQNAAKNALVCYEQTVEAERKDRPLACFAPADLKNECCLPEDHYKKKFGENLWK